VCEARIDEDCRSEQLLEGSDDPYAQSSHERRHSFGLQPIEFSLLRRLPEENGLIAAAHERGIVSLLSLQSHRVD